MKLEERGVASTSSTHLAPRDGDCLTSNDRLLVTAQSLNWQRIEQVRVSLLSRLYVMMQLALFILWVACRILCRTLFIARGAGSTWVDPCQ